MEFQVINRSRNAVIPEGMFKLCGMEDVKLISMVQLNGGILLMPESVSTYQLLMLIDALNEQACESKKTSRIWLFAQRFCTSRTTSYSAISAHGLAHDGDVAHQIDRHQLALDDDLPVHQVGQEDLTVLDVDALHIAEHQIFRRFLSLIDVCQAHSVIAPYSIAASTVDSRMLPFSKSDTASMICS